MTFKHPSSQLIHSSLMFYIQHPQPRSLHHFKSTLLKASNEALMERNKDKHSHLENIIILLQESSHSQGNKNLYIHRLIKVLMEVCSDNLLVCRHLLLSKDDVGVDVIDKILFGENSPVLGLYFQEVKKLAKKDPLALLSYRNLHLDSIDQLSLLMRAMQAEINSRNLELYFEELQNCVADGIFTLSEYNKILTEPNTVLFTPLHYVIISGNSENLKIYFKVLQYALEHQMITPASYSHLLVMQNIGGFTPLLGLLYDGDYENLNLYFTKLADALSKGLLHRAHYGRLLIQPNTAGFTPMNQAIKSNNFASFRLYFDKLHEAFIHSSISVDAYRKALIDANKSNFSPLLQAFKAGDTKIISFYLEAIHRAYDANILSSSNLSYLLTASNNRGFSPLHDILYFGEPNNLTLYMDELHFAVRERIISPDNFLNILTQKNNENSTLIHFAARSGHFKIVTALFSILEKELSKRVLLDLLNEKNHEGLYAKCLIINVDKFKINQFLNDKRQELELLFESRRSIGVRPSPVFMTSPNPLSPPLVFMPLFPFNPLSPPILLNPSYPLIPLTSYSINMRENPVVHPVPLTEEYSLFSSKPNPFDITVAQSSTLEPFLIKRPYEFIYQAGLSIFSKPVQIEGKENYTPALKT